MMFLHIWCTDGTANILLFRKILPFLQFCLSVIRPVRILQALRIHEYLQDLSYEEKGIYTDTSYGRTA